MLKILEFEALDFIKFTALMIRDMMCFKRDSNVSAAKTCRFGVTFFIKARNPNLEPNMARYKFHISFSTRYSVLKNSLTQL
jgi:hypothetical protein